MAQPPQGPGWGNQPGGWNQSNPNPGPPGQFGPPQQFGGPRGQPPFGPGGGLAGTAAKTGGLSALAKGLIGGGAALVLIGGGVVVAMDPLGLRTPDTATAKVAPADTIAYLGLDLQPSPAQQAEMVRFGLKFPSVRDKLSLTENGDLRKTVFDSVLKARPCPAVDFDRDIEPWLGESAALYLRPGSTSPITAIAARDENQARSVVQTLNGCGTVTAVSLSYVDGHLLISESAGASERAAADVKAGSLADRAEFRQDMAKLGATGLLSAWADMDGLRALFQQGNQTVNPLPGVDFGRSVAGTLRFTAGNPELVTVVKATEAVGDYVPTKVGDLPADTALAWGLIGGRAIVSRVMDILSASGMDAATLSSQTGLQLPGDLETVLGDDFIVSADRIDQAALSDPSQAPIGATVKTDRGQLAAALNRFANSGVTLIHLGDRETSYVSLNSAYAQKLQNPGSRLGDTPGFKAAVAEPGKAAAA